MILLLSCELCVFSCLARVSDGSAENLMEMLFKIAKITKHRATNKPCNLDVRNN